MTPQEVLWVKGLECAVREMDKRLRSLELDRVRKQAASHETNLREKKIVGKRREGLIKKYAVKK